MDLFSIIFILTLLDSISSTQAGLLDAMSTFLDPDHYEKPLKAFNPLYQNNDAKEGSDTRSDENLDRGNDHPSDWQNLRNQQDSQNFENDQHAAKHNGDEAGSGENVDQNKHPGWRNSQNKQNPNIQDDFDPSLRRIDEFATKINTAKNNEAEGLVSRYKDNKNQTNNRDRGWRNSQNQENLSMQDFGPSSKRRNEFENSKAAEQKRKYNVGDKELDNKEEPIASTTEKALEAKVLKPLTRKKFYYQAQPVVPENERKEIKETIYYVD